MQVLYSMIHERAETSWGEDPISIANFKVWREHWFDTAETLANEFAAEGLAKTAEALREIVKEQRALFGILE